MLFAQQVAQTTQSLDLISLIANGGSAGVCLAMLIYFLKYIRHRDHLDTQRHVQCEATISGIVKDHKESQSKLLRIISRELNHDNPDTTT